MAALIIVFDRTQTIYAPRGGGDLTKEQKFESISQGKAQHKFIKCISKSSPRGKIPNKRQAMYISLISCELNLV